MLKNALFVFALASFSIAAVPNQAPSTKSIHPNILGGSASDESQDAVVMILEHNAVTNTRVGICTGALVAPRLVLTARHCVANVNPALLACDVDGTPLQGGEIGDNKDPQSFYIFTGKSRPAFTGVQAPDLDPAQWKPAGQGADIIDDKSGTLCNHDLALLLLKDPINNVPLASMRLDRNAIAGEKLLTIGWGVSTSEVEPTTRQQRRDVNTKRVGPSTDLPTLTKSEFLFDESICLGDSGGPVFSQETNAIIGVVSRGGNGLDPNKGGPASTCTEAANIGTKLSPFKELVIDAFKRAGAEPKLEVVPEDEDCAIARSRPLGSRRTVGGSAILLGMTAALMVFRRRRGLANKFRQLSP